MGLWVVVVFILFSLMGERCRGPKCGEGYFCDYLCGVLVLLGLILVVGLVLTTKLVDGQWSLGTGFECIYKVYVCLCIQN